MENTTTFSSHMPIVGVYVALASLACLGLMVHDIGAAYLARCRWIPCKYFPLNSITIQLLTIAGKVSLDLTTKMPRLKDQLSKLSGTTFICICMVFFLPSLGITKKSECFINLISLTLFVFTVVGKVSFQISSRVIDSYFVYLHIIILGFMFFILITLWVTAWDIHNRNRISIDENKAILYREDVSMFQRLKRSCLAAYLSNPQLLTSVSPTNGVSFLTICFLLGSLIPSVREIFTSESSDRKFYGGESEYRWSIKIISGVQILTCLVVGVAIIFRIMNMKFGQVQYVPTYVDYEFENMIQKNPILESLSIRDKYSRMFLKIYVKFLVGVQSITLRCWYGTANPEGSSTGWQERKGLEYLRKVVDGGLQKSTTQLHELLADIASSGQWHAMDLRDQEYPNQSLPVNSLSLVLLVRIAEVSLPADLWRRILNTFTEVKKILYYTEKHTNKKTLENDKRLILAKAVWAGKDFRFLLNKISSAQGQLECREAYNISKLSSVLPPDPVRVALSSVADFINRREYQSRQDLFMSIQQTFVDMLHVMLSQLPIAIFNLLNDCPPEKYQKNVAKAVSFLCQVNSVEAQIPWSFPVGSNISRLITEEDIHGANASEFDGNQAGVELV